METLLFEFEETNLMSNAINIKGEINKKWSGKGGVFQIARAYSPLAGDVDPTRAFRNLGCANAREFLDTIVSKEIKIFKNI